MPLDVLIATPSGPFGELIRLSLEADPQFKCAIINNSSEIYSALKNAEVQVVIFDCSFQEIDPGDIVELVKTKSPAPVVLFVPPENRPDNNALQRAHPDGLITRPFDASVLPYTAEELEPATHRKELPAPRYTVVNILGAMRGVGGDDSWGACTHEEYLLKTDKKMEFSFVFKGL